MAFNTSYCEPLLAQAIPQPMPQPLLDSLIPGFSIISGIFTHYFQIDLSFYLSFLVLLMGVTAGFNYCGTIVFDFFKDWLISTTEIRLDDEMYNYVMYWVSTQHFSQVALRFVAGTKTTSEVCDDRWQEGAEDREQYNEDEDLELIDGHEDERLRMAHRDKYKTLQYTPSTGTHFFWYKGRLLAFARHREDKQTAMWVSYSETIYISCLGRNSQILKQLLEEAQRAYLERDGNKTVIYRASKKSGEDGADWVRCMSRPPRPLSTVVLDPAQKQAFIDDMEEYLHPLTRRWYSNRGIPYRRGYILHGPPGTGKTSLCFAVAGLFGLKIYVVSLNSRTLTEDSLAALFQNLPRRCIVLLEDIDTAGITQKRGEEKDAKAEAVDQTKGTSSGNGENKGISLSGLLNVIDGVASSEGRILVMTTNHIEKIDGALLRPGRVDMNIRFGYADAATIKGLFNAIYTHLEGDLPAAKTEANGHAVETRLQQNGTVPSISEKKLPGSVTPPRFINDKRFHHDHPAEEIASLASEFATLIPDGEFTSAEVQGYLLKNKNSPNRAVSEAEAWVREVREENEKRKTEKEKEKRKTEKEKEKEKEKEQKEKEEKEKEQKEKEEKEKESKSKQEESDEKKPKPEESDRKVNDE